MAGLCGLSRLVGILSSILSLCVHVVPFLNECLPHFKCAFVFEG